MAIEKKLFVVFTFSLFLNGSLLGAETECAQFRIEGSNLLFEGNNNGLQSGSLAVLGNKLGKGELVRIDFPQSEICVIEGGELESGAAALVLNSEIDELAVSASIDGVYDLLLRLDLNLQTELLLERRIGEDLGLTEMEFLSDNSGVGAEDFFAEEIAFLEISGTELDALFAEIPRFGISYNHYEGLDNTALGDADITRGSLGLAVLRGLVLTIDYSLKALVLRQP